MAYLPGVNRVVIFSVLRGCTCVDPLTGAVDLVTFEMEPPSTSEEEQKRNMFRRKHAELLRSPRLSLASHLQSVPVCPQLASYGLSPSVPS